MKTISPALIVAFVSIANQAQAIDLYAGAKPQSTQHTCQSYSAVLALDAIGDPSFSYQNFEELRTAEQRFREILTDLGDTTSHQNWAVGMENFTDGKYTIRSEPVQADIVKFLEKAKSYTTIRDSYDLLLSDLSGGNVATALTSVTSLAGDNYGTGHIVALLGVIGSGLNSETQLVVFNSAIKSINGAEAVCKEGGDIVLDGDVRYSAGIVATNEFQLKLFNDGNYRILRIVEK